MKKIVTARRETLRNVTTCAPISLRESRWGKFRRQCICLGLLSVFTFGCSESTPPTGAIGHVRAYFGGVAADEPEAVLIARDVLSAGGSAVDAVVSMGLAMMVTRPDAAGAGGGGMCVVFDSKSGKGEAIEFLPRAATSKAPSGHWVASAPGSFRGLFALQARYGRLRWEQLVLPAERLARFGVRAPRGLTKALAGQAKLALKGSRSRAIFFDLAGVPLKEGDVLRQVDLAATLGRIRIAGPGDFYSGPLARNFADGVMDAGGWLPIEDLRAYRPNWIKAKQGKFGPHDLYFLPTPATGGEVAAGIWSKLGNKSGLGSFFKKAEKNEMATKVAAAARQGYAGVLAAPRLNSMIMSVGALALDRLGNSAACVFTMGNPFGSGQIAGDTGVMAAKPAQTGALLALSAMIVGNPNTNQTFMAATGAGDQFASSAMMGVVLRVLEGNEKVEPALEAARSAAAAGQDGVLVEPKVPLAQKQALGELAGRVKEVPHIGQVNIMWCPDGVAYLPEKCVVHTDPRGYGHAINAEF